MAVVPTPPSILSGVVTSTELAALTAVLNFLLNPPIAILRAATGQSVPTGTWSAVQFDASDRDSAGGHSNTTNNTRYVAQYAGVYQLDGSGAQALNATGVRGSSWYVNGVGLPQQGQLLPATAASFGPAVAAPGQKVFLNVGDYVELRIFQNSGGALNSQIGCCASIGWTSN